MKRLSWLIALGMFAGSAEKAASEPASDRSNVLAVIDSWYAELVKREQGRPYSLTSTSFIDASPPLEYLDTGAAKLRPMVHTSLAARALAFSYEAASVRLDSSFAKVRVWEKGFFYAYAAESTYELAASTLFILEREEASGRWMILAHQTMVWGFLPVSRQIHCRICDRFGRTSSSTTRRTLSSSSSPCSESVHSVPFSRGTDTRRTNCQLPTRSHSRAFSPYSVRWASTARPLLRWLKVRSTASSMSKAQTF